MTDKRNNNFILLNMLGACKVIFAHQFALLRQPMPGWLETLIDPLGAKMIFVVVGYLVTQSCLRETSLSRFFKRRAIRIFPALWFYLFVTVFVIGPLFTQDPLCGYFSDCWRFLFHNMFLKTEYFLPGIFLRNPFQALVNASLWSLPVQFALYAIAGTGMWCVLRLPSRLRLPVYTSAVLLAMLCTIAKVAFWPQFRLRIYGISIPPISNVASFFLTGSLIAYAKWERLCRPAVWLPLYIAVRLLPEPYRAAGTVVILPCAVLAAGLHLPPLRLQFFSVHNIAYGLYLWGWTVQQALIAVLHVESGLSLSPYVYYLLSLTTTALIAGISRNCVEIPAERILKKRLL